MDDLGSSNNDKKYPKSNSGFQCIGPCYKPGTIVVHPITLEYITNNDQPFCPVKEWTEVMSSGDKRDRIIDECLNPTHIKNVSKKELEMNMLIPYIDFNCEQFLKIYYNIYSFEDALIWLEKNDFVPVNNKLRIVNCSFSVYGSTLDVADYRVVAFIIDIVKARWINILYNKLNKFISIKDQNIFIADPHSNKLSTTEYTVQRINYILNTFITPDEITKFLEKYIKYRRDTWEEISSHINKLRDDLVEYIQEKMQKTIAK